MNEIDELFEQVSEYRQDLKPVPVSLNVPNLLWRAVHVISELRKTTMTNVVVRFLNDGTIIQKVRYEDPDATFWVKHGDGSVEQLPLGEFQAKSSD